MRKAYSIIVIAIFSFAICFAIQFILNKRTESKIAGASHTIEVKLKSKDSLQMVVGVSGKERKKFLSAFGGDQKMWKNLEYTLTFSKARTTAYYLLEQQFVEECKQYGLKDSEAFFDFVSGHSAKKEQERMAGIEKYSTEISDTIKARQQLRSEIIQFTRVIIWTLILMFVILAIQWVKKRTVRPGK